MNDFEITTQFLTQLSDKQRQIQDLWDMLYAGEWDETRAAALTAVVHQLAGAALTLGYSKMGNAARALETGLKNVGNGQDVWAGLNAKMRDLQASMVKKERDGTLEQQLQIVQSLKNIPSLQDMRSNSLIYIVEDDVVQAENIAVQIGRFGYSVQAFTQLGDLRTALSEMIPAAVLMDIIFPEGELAGADEIRRLQEEFEHTLPVFFLSIRDDLSARLQAIRAGGKAYFTKPVDVSALVDALDKIVVYPNMEPYRVMIVDDSEVQANVNALHLRKAKIEVATVTKPMDLMPLLEDFNPDLLLLDLYMPDCTGLELAKLIRQMNQFVSLPIVYLSAETDREKQLAAVGLGGDDFLVKPIRPDHLVTAVSSRIQRYRQLRTLMRCDSLTGLLNHTTIRERLSQELSRAARQGTPLALAMIDIDHFKTVNDTYGHATGDRVLKSLSHMLSRRLRNSDIIGRYGGEEFVIILPNTEREAALRLMDTLRDAFGAVRHISDGNEFCITFSCGIATFPERQTPSGLSEAADQALYQAKQMGRNRVVLSAA